MFIPHILSAIIRTVCLHSSSCFVNADFVTVNNIGRSLMRCNYCFLNARVCEGTDLGPAKLRCRTCAKASLKCFDVTDESRAKYPQREHRSRDPNTTAMKMCDNCRGLSHRKSFKSQGLEECDRHLFGCQHCKRKGWKCIYPELKYSSTMQSSEPGDKGKDKHQERGVSGPVPSHQATHQTSMSSSQHDRNLMPPPAAQTHLRPRESRQSAFTPPKEDLAGDLSQYAPDVIQRLNPYSAPAGPPSARNPDLHDNSGAVGQHAPAHGHPSHPSSHLPSQQQEHHDYGDLYAADSPASSSEGLFVSSESDSPSPAQMQENPLPGVQAHSQPRGEARVPGSGAQGQHAPAHGHPSHPSSHLPSQQQEHHDHGDLYAADSPAPASEGLFVSSESGSSSNADEQENPLPGAQDHPVPWRSGPSVFRPPLWTLLVI